MRYELKSYDVVSHAPPTYLYCSIMSNCCLHLSIPRVNFVYGQAISLDTHRYLTIYSRFLYQIKIMYQVKTWFTCEAYAIPKWTVEFVFYLSLILASFYFYVISAIIYHRRATCQFRTPFYNCVLLLAVGDIGTILTCCRGAFWLILIIQNLSYHAPVRLRANSSPLPRLGISNNIFC